MAAYRRVNACTQGSAPGPTLGVEYGKPLHLAYYLKTPKTSTRRPYIPQAMSADDVYQLG